MCGVLRHLAPVQRCACSVCCFACAVSWATWLLFTGVPARCVALRVRCPGPLGSCSPVCPLGVLFCVCGVSATWLRFTGVPARCVASRVWCHWPPGSCSPVFPLGGLFCVCGVWAGWLRFTGVPTRCDVLRVRCPGPLGSYSPVCLLAVLLPACGVLGHLAPVPRCACSVCCVACAVSWATWLLFSGVPGRWVVLRVRCLGHLAPVHRCACSVCCVASRVWCPGPSGSCSPVFPLGGLFCVCGVWAGWLRFTGVPTRRDVLRVRYPGPLGSYSTVCLLAVLLPACGVLGHLAPVPRCACSVCCVACAVSWATWLLFSGVPARWVLLRVWCPGPPGSCSLVCLLGVLCCVSGVLGHVAPVLQCARSVGCFACAVTWATWLRFTGVPTRCDVLRVRCPGPRGSCSPVCRLVVLFCVCGVLGH